MKSMFKHMRLIALLGGLGLFALALLPGAGGVRAAGLLAKKTPAPAAAETPPPMPVQAMVVQESDAQLWTDFSGRLDAVDYAEIRPQVSGTVKEIKFEDGQDVQKGDVLYVIDPGPYEAAVAQAVADLAAARSKADFSDKQLQRAADLLKTNAISKDLMDERSNDQLVAKNAVDSAAAKLKQARIDLDRAYVKAPIAGRVGRAEITEGNLVQSGPNAPLLTTIVSNAEIYADFDVDEQTYVAVRRAAQDASAEREVPVKMTVRGDEAKTYDGTIHSFDNKINPDTGTIRARALFKNEDGTLLPGMLVNVKLGSAGSNQRILIPEAVISTDQDRKFVYVVDKTGKVIYREVKLGAAADGQRVVLSGLQAGETIITDGLFRIHPDMMVVPQYQDKSAAAGAVPADAADLLEKVEPAKN